MKHSLPAVGLAAFVTPLASAQLHTGFPGEVIPDFQQMQFGPFGTNALISTECHGGTCYRDMCIWGFPYTNRGGMRVLPPTLVSPNFTGDTCLFVWECDYGTGMCINPYPIVPSGERIWYAVSHESATERYHGFVQVLYDENTGFILEAYRFEEDPSTPVRVEMLRECYPDCETSSGAGVLDIFDFLCFQDEYLRATPYACDCDISSGPGVCDVFDFLCFQDAFVAGCP